MDVRDLDSGEAGESWVWAARGLFTPKFSLRCFLPAESKGSHPTGDQGWKYMDEDERRDK
jgi:hypothetical protein